MSERFGESHSDDADAPAGLSSMVSLSDLPGDTAYDHGRFHIAALGVYVVLKPYLTIFFCGRLQHGGTGPIAPRGQTAEPWHYRLVSIAYPSGKIQAGECRHSFAGQSTSGDPLLISPEMTGIL